MQTLVEQIAALRPSLVSTARTHLRNPAWVEDAVSETLMAALEGAARYDGRAPLQQWLTGILRHKVVDQVRRHTRECAFQEHDADGEGGADDHPADWGDPLEGVMQRQFLDRFERCLRRLPPRQGRAFLLRNWLGEETETICQELGVTAGHLHVMLHRARSGLRNSLLAHATA